MKERLRNNVLRSCLVVIAFLLASCAAKDTHEHDTYTCPMHPTVVSDKPGVCPVCDMDLVKKLRPGEEVKITEDLSKLIKSPNAVVMSAIKTVRGEFKSMPVTVEGQGVVTYDTRNLYTIPSRVSGRLEKVYLKYFFQAVKKGQKVAEVYSPEMVAAQQEFLYVMTHDPDNTELIESAKNKLLLLGFSQQQWNELVKRREAFYTVSVYSAYDGYVVPERSPAPSGSNATPAGSMSGGMPSGTTNVTSAADNEALIREGAYVSAGQTLFKMVNTSSLWIELDFPGGESHAVKAGDTVELDWGGGVKENAAIDFVQPFFTEGQAFVKVRVRIKQKQNMHPGQLVRGRITFQTKESLWLPREAVLDLGLEHIVFVKERGVFKSKKIVAGQAAGDWREVSGLSTSDEIAANASYLVDSESFIKTTK